MVEDQKEDQMVGSGDRRSRGKRGETRKKKRPQLGGGQVLL